MRLTRVSRQPAWKRSHWRITASCPPSGDLYVIAIHLVYGLKGVAHCTKADGTASQCRYGSVAPFDIDNPQDYTFASTATNVPSGGSGTNTVSSHNVFKRDPGIAGLVLDSHGTPVANAHVQIIDGSGNVLPTVYTDENGFFMWFYKYTGKPTTFTVQLPGYNMQASFPFKGNGFVTIIFHLPGRDGSIPGYVEIYARWL